MMMVTENSLIIRVGETYRLRAITTFEGIDNFYVEMKKQTRRARDSHSEPNDRKRLCDQIFSHPYFETKNEMVLDPDHKGVIADIVEYYRYIAFVLYEKSKKPRKYYPSWCRGDRAQKSKLMSRWTRCYNEKPAELRKCFTWCRYSTEYNYVNAPVDRTVFAADEEFTESVFMCPVLKEDNDIVVYFVSDHDYDVNEAVNSNEIIEYIPGRFIFSRDESDQARLSVLLLVEDTAVVRRTPEIEEFYLSSQVVQTLVDDEKDDPVCSLKDEQKLRLCSTVLNSDVLEDEIEFLSEKDSVIYECKKKQISFHIQSSVADQHVQREQWMIGCKARTLNDGYIMTYHISRGYRVNTAYLYTSSPSEEAVFLCHFYSNVSVLRD